MNKKLELQQKANAFIDEINSALRYNFELLNITENSNSTYRYDEDNRDSVNDETYYVFKSNIHSHRIWLYYRPNDDGYKFMISYRKNGINSKTTKKYFDTKLELAAYINKPTFKR